MDSSTGLRYAVLVVHVNLSRKHTRYGRKLMSDFLGDRMKSYEVVTRSVLLPHSYTILRVDGRAFHTYLRGAQKPFDAAFISDMQNAGAELCREISGAVFAYGQSDEISVLITDLEPQAQPWFGGVIQKIVSVAASIATGALIECRGIYSKPQFDARVFTLPSAGEVQNYFIWRQRDAVRNSVSMAAQAKFSPSQLHGKNSGEMQEMLFSMFGINWNNYLDECKRGWVITREVREAEVTYIDKRTQTEQETMALRTFMTPAGAPHFSFDCEFFQTVQL